MFGSSNPERPVGDRASTFHMTAAPNGGAMKHFVKRFVWSALVLVPLLGTPIAFAANNSDGEDEEHFVEFSKEHRRGQPKADKALIYVLRPTNVGFAVKSWFFSDGEVLGVNRGSSYFFAEVDPGKRVFWSKSENVDAVELEVGAGKTYYLQQHVKIGGLKARTKLEVLDATEGQTRLANCTKHGVLTDKGLARGAELAAEFRDRTAEDLARRQTKVEE